MTDCYQPALPYGKRPTRCYHPGEANSLFSLAGGGVYTAKIVTDFAVRSYRTISPLPVPGNISANRAIGCVFSAALSRGFPRVAVSHHRALSCSDFPPRRSGATARPTLLNDY